MNTGEKVSWPRRFHLKINNLHETEGNEFQNYQNTINNLDLISINKWERRYTACLEGTPQKL